MLNSCRPKTPRFSNASAEKKDKQNLGYQNPGIGGRMGISGDSSNEPPECK